MVGAADRDRGVAGDVAVEATLAAVAGGVGRVGARGAGARLQRDAEVGPSAGQDVRRSGSPGVGAVHPQHIVSSNTVRSQPPTQFRGESKDSKLRESKTRESKLDYANAAKGANSAAPRHAYRYGSPGGGGGNGMSKQGKSRPCFAWIARNEAKKGFGFLRCDMLVHLAWNWLQYCAATFMCNGLSHCLSRCLCMCLWMCLLCFVWVVVVVVCEDNLTSQTPTRLSSCFNNAFAGSAKRNSSGSRGVTRKRNPPTIFSSEHLPRMPQLHPPMPLGMPLSIRATYTGCP